MKRRVLEALLAARAARRPVALLTPLGGGEARLWPADEKEGQAELPPELRRAADLALSSDEAFTVEVGGEPVFVNPFQPPPRLAIVGAVHIAEPLAAVAAVLGYEVTIVDPRRAFTRAERWPPGVLVRPEWPDEAFADMALDRRSAVVALSHDPKIDDPALTAALRSGAFYIGALGSKKTHAARLRRLSQEGFSEADLARVHGPVGLAIGARSPAEIAVAIAGQMTEELRR